MQLFTVNAHRDFVLWSGLSHVTFHWRWCSSSSKRHDERNIRECPFADTDLRSGGMTWRWPGPPGPVTSEVTMLRRLTSRIICCIVRIHRPLTLELLWNQWINVSTFDLRSIVCCSLWQVLEVKTAAPWSDPLQLPEHLVGGTNSYCWFRGAAGAIVLLAWRNKVGRSGT